VIYYISVHLAKFCGQKLISRSRNTEGSAFAASNVMQLNRPERNGSNVNPNFGLGSASSANVTLCIARPCGSLSLASTTSIITKTHHKILLTYRTTFDCEGCCIVCNRFWIPKSVLRGFAILQSVESAKFRIADCSGLAAPPHNR
jgi:hypothetical protein